MGLEIGLPMDENFFICLFLFFIICYFTIKVVRAEAAGAAGVIVTDQVSDLSP